MASSKLAMSQTSAFGDTEQSNENSQPSRVLRELRMFLSVATNSNKVRSSEITKSAIYLLQTLPAARDGVLEYLYNLFDEAVNNYVLKLELEDNANVAGNVMADEITIEELRTILIDFVKNNPDSWAPIIFKWSLDLLGYLSRKYSDRRIVPHSSSLPEILQLWMACCPTRTLMDLTTHCILFLINTNPDMCITVLLEISAQYSPHFDWAVAHIGSCFPTTIVTKVLFCGLRDFCNQEQATNTNFASTSTRSDSSSSNVPKMASVVGILGHLAAQHSEEIRKALVNLFLNSLNENPTKEQYATVPFLLHLASMSDMLLQVITSEISHLLTAPVLNQLCDQVSRWKANQIPGTEGLVKLAVHLLLRSEKWGISVLQQLLDTAMACEVDGDVRLKPEVSEAAGLVLDHLLLEIQHQVHSGKLEIPLLQCLKEHVLRLCNYIKKDTKDASFVLNLLKFICLQGGENVSVTVLGQLLCIVEGNQEFSDFLHLLHYVQLSQPTILLQTVSRKIAEMKLGRIAEPVCLVDNLAFLVQLESHQCLEIFLPNLDALAVQVAQPDINFAGAVVQLLANCVCPEAMSVSSLLSISSAVVAFIFRFICTRPDDDSMSALKTCRDLLSSLCRHSATQNALLRMLLEGVLHPDHVIHFGSIVQLQKLTASAKKPGASLLLENRKHSTSVTVPQSHSSVFHAGVIGDGLRAQWKGTLVSKEKAAVNRQAFIEMLIACCNPVSGTNEIASPVEGTKSLALLMVELISPDVMFNGLPWPDEEYMKVTIERDLAIKKLFDENVILWDVLYLIATIHPSLCYCSVLLRAIAAVCISYWSSCQDKVTSHSPKQLDTTQKVLDLMALGQLLPPSLGAISEIAPLLTPFEMFCLFSDVWQYMRDHVPSPALFTTEDGEKRFWREFDLLPAKYTDRLRFILQSNIQKLGDFYGRYFSEKVE